jgi:hypothetical protein
MPTNLQLRLIHTAARKIALADEQYRMILLNAAGVESAKDLDNSGIEDVMAVMEDMGFRDHKGDPEYWRNKVRRRGVGCSERMQWKIEAMGREGRYDIAAMCLKFSKGRTADVRRLEAWEGYGLIEMLKAAAEREEETEATCPF